MFKRASVNPGRMLPGSSLIQLVSCPFSCFALAVAIASSPASAKPPTSSPKMDPSSPGVCAVMCCNQAGGCVPANISAHINHLRGKPELLHHHHHHHRQARHQHWHHQS